LLVTLARKICAGMGFVAVVMAVNSLPFKIYSLPCQYSNLPLPPVIERHHNQQGKADGRGQRQNQQPIEQHEIRTFFRTVFFNKAGRGSWFPTLFAKSAKRMGHPAFWGCWFALTHTSATPPSPSARRGWREWCRRPRRPALPRPARWRLTSRRPAVHSR